jgi:hypothetical protein
VNVFGGGNDGIHQEDLGFYHGHSGLTGNSIGGDDNVREAGGNSFKNTA